MTQPLVLINPKSGRKKGISLVKKLQKNYPDIPFYMPADRDRFKETIEKYGSEHETIIIAGGDGTINLVVPYFMQHPEKKLAIFPVGSGNGFAMETGFKSNFDNLLEDIRQGESAYIDVIRINGKYACNVAGLGLDGKISHLFLDQSSRGLFKYIWLTLSTIYQFYPFSAIVEFAGGRIQGEFLSVVFANTRQFGNKAFIAPEAVPGDGKMNVVMVKKMPWIKLLPFFVKLFTKNLKSHSYVQMLETQETIQVKTEFSYGHTDGEPFKTDKNFNVEIINKAIRILKTRNYTY